MTFFLNKATNLSRADIAYFILECAKIFDIAKNRSIDLRYRSEITDKSTNDISSLKNLFEELREAERTRS